MTLPECTCADYDPEVYDGDDCGCRRCPQVARGTAGCPHRLEKVAGDPGGFIGSYGGMCDRCFAEAREVRACGLRVAEHAPSGRPDQTGTLPTKLKEATSP